MTKMWSTHHEIISFFFFFFFFLEWLGKVQNMFHSPFGTFWHFNPSCLHWVCSAGSKYHDAESISHSNSAHHPNNTNFWSCQRTTMPSFLLFFLPFPHHVLHCRAPTPSPATSRWNIAPSKLFPTLSLALVPPPHLESLANSQHCPWTPSAHQVPVQVQAGYSKLSPSSQTLGLGP
jgi:hypothetical protein